MSKLALSNWLRCTLIVARKEIDVELRARHAIGTISLFAISTLIAVSSALNGANMRSEVKAGLLWIVLLFAALSGLSRVFVREQEGGTAAYLRLFAPSTSIYCGKLFFNLLLVFGVEAISVPLFFIFISPETVHYALLIGVLALGGWGIASGATFIAALIANASAGKSGLFFIVAFPVLMPLLLIAVQATVGAFSSVDTYVTRAVADLGVLGAYCIVSTVAALMLFDYVWYD